MSKINLNELDPEFKHQVAEQPGGEGLNACFACKACTAACPVQPLEKRYDPRKIIRMVLLGIKRSPGERFYLVMFFMLQLSGSMSAKCAFYRSDLRYKKSCG